MILLFLIGFTREIKSHGMGDYVYKRKYEIDLKSIEDFIPIEVLKKSLEKIDKSQTMDSEKRAIDAFDPESLAVTTAWISHLDPIHRAYLRSLYVAS